MSDLPIFFLRAFEITLLDLALCGDNIGIIALATRNLPKKHAKIASLIGIAGAIMLRIYFAVCLSVFLKLKWLPIKLIGGILLIKITWDLIKPGSNKEEHTINPSSKFWDAVLAVIIADVSMSLDNVLAIAGAADGNIILLAFGIAVNIPIIFLGSQFVVNIMKKSPIIIYIGGAILAFTAVSMIIEDYIFKFYITLPHIFSLILPWAAAALTLLYGICFIFIDGKKTVHTKNIKKVS